jgi:NADP-dependent 3-hydroxy acid dehydrogenase YdfG
METTTSKNIIVVGASGGIGSILARVFCENGHRVALAARGEEKLLALQAELGADKTIVVPTDASRLPDIENLFAKTQEAFGSVDVVVISAGTWKRLAIDDTAADAEVLVREHFDKIFLPSFLIGFVAQQFFVKQGHGLIANISSHAAIRPDLPGNLTYGPLKAASRHYMHALRHELAGTQVRVTDIEPAIVDTKDTAALLGEDRRSQAVQPESIANWILEHIDNPEIPESIVFTSSVEL